MSEHSSKTTGRAVKSAGRAGRHGHYRGGKPSPTYRSWKSMRERCYNPNHVYYNRYGGAGVEVFAPWKDDFMAFLKDMGERPKGTSLDRIDPTLGYTPDNCRWASSKQQGKNRRSTRTVRWEGREYSMRELCKKLGRVYPTVMGRLYKGQTLSEALKLNKEEQKCLY